MIYLDVDGVLSKFAEAAIEIYFPNEIGRAAFTAKYPRGEWSIPKVLGLSEEIFWGDIGARLSFWSQLGMYPEAEPLYQALAARDDVCFLTNANDELSFWSNRAGWLTHHLGIAPRDLRLVICHGHTKSVFSQNGAILVDDNDKNCDEWGPNSILYPQIWNCNHALADQGIDKVAWVLDQYETRKGAK